MKKILFSIVLLLTLSISVLPSCNKLKELAKVTLNLDNADGEFTIPIIVAVGDATLGTDNVYLNLDSMIKAQDNAVGAGNIKEVKIKSCVLTLTNGDAKNNFSALETCKMEISSNQKPDYITIASVTNNPDVAAQTLNLSVNNTLELKDYFLSANQFTYRLSGKTRKTTDKELNCKVTVQYTLVAGL